MKTIVHLHLRCLNLFRFVTFYIFFKINTLYNTLFNVEPQWSSG